MSDTSIFVLVVVSLKWMSDTSKFLFFCCVTHVNEQHIKTSDSRFFFWVTHQNDTSRTCHSCGWVVHRWFSYVSRAARACKLQVIFRKRATNHRALLHVLFRYIFTRLMNESSRIYFEKSRTSHVTNTHESCRKCKWVVHGLCTVITVLIACCAHVDESCHMYGQVKYTRTNTHAHTHFDTHTWHKCGIHT